MAAEWWSALCGRGWRHRQLLPWLHQVGRLQGHDHGYRYPQRGDQRRVDVIRGVALGAAAPDGKDLYRTSCIVGHLEVDDGVSPRGERLWHCRRPGCGAGRFAGQRPASCG